MTTASSWFETTNVSELPLLENDRNETLHTKYTSQTMVLFYRAYISPIVAILGVIGNIIAFFVFLTEHRKTRFTVYCVALAITDTIALILNSFMDDFFGRGFKYHGLSPVKFDTQSAFMCKMMEYLPNVAYFGSSYLLICFSFDRVLTICNPVKYLSERYMRRAIFVCIATLFVSMTINMPMMIANNLTINSSHGVNNKKCETPGYDNVSKFALYLKVIVVFSIPTVTILILNSIIIGKLCQIHRARQRLLSNPKENRMEMGRVIGHFSLSTIFFLLNLPLVIVLLLRLHASSNNWKKLYPETYSNLKHLSRFFSSVKDINYGINFFLYFAFLSMFRWRFLSLVCGRCIHCDFFKRIPGHSMLLYGIERYERNLEPNRKRSVIATLAHQVTNNAFGVIKQSSTKSTCGRNSASRDNYEMTTEIVNSESYDTHM